MEAMTQEFMLHRRPHVEIWSAREGSDDDNDSLQRQPGTLKGSTSVTKSLMDPNQQTQTKPKDRIHFRNQNIWWILNHTQPQTMGTQMHHLRKIWWVITNPKRSTSKTQVFFPGFDYTSYKNNRRQSQILTARILRRRKSRRRIGKP